MHTQEVDPSTAYTHLVGLTTSAMTATSWGGDRVDMFVRSTAGTLVQNARGGGTWSGWADLGGSIVGHPVAVSRGFNRVAVITRNSVGALEVLEFNGAGWLPRRTIPASVVGRPSVVVRPGTDDLDIYAHWSDDSVRTISSSAIGTWEASWTNLGGLHFGSPGAVALSTTEQYVFVRATNDQLMFRRRTAAGFGAWQTLGGGITGSPSAVSRGPGIIDVFVRGTNGQLYTISRGAAGTFSGWVQIGVLGGSGLSGSLTLRGPLR